MVGLYIHIPFCVRKCKYCDFVSFSNHENDFNAYLDALSREMAEYKGEEVNSIFIGGGTPSVLNAKQLDRLFRDIKNNFSISSDCEFSMEVNPGTLNNEKIRTMALGGINRVSVGVQSFNDNELSAIGRIHTADEAKDAVLRLYAGGIKNINLDLMTSIPYQTRESLIKSVDIALSLPITHISAYSLILEDGTPLLRDYEDGKFTLPEDDEDREMFSLLLNRLRDSGFSRYEISNFAKEGYECRHNIKYWQCKEYIGLGLSAHSYLRGKRFYNTSDLMAYLKGGFHSDDITELSRNDKISEFMMLGLRMSRGVSEAEFKRRFDTDIKAIFKNELNKFINLGFMEYNGEYYYLNDRGMDISNSIMCEFIL